MVVVGSLGMRGGSKTAAEEMGEGSIIMQQLQGGLPHLQGLQEDTSQVRDYKISLILILLALVMSWQM